MDTSYELDRVVTGSIACEQESDMNSTELSLGAGYARRFAHNRAKNSRSPENSPVKALYALIIQESYLGGVEEIWPLPHLGSTRRQPLQNMGPCAILSHTRLQAQ